MVLEVRQFLPPEAIESKLQKKLNDSSFHLPITHLVPCTRGLHEGIYDGCVTNEIMGKCPSHLMIFLLSNKQVNGDLSVDSYFFNPRDFKPAYLIKTVRRFPWTNYHFSQRRKFEKL